MKHSSRIIKVIYSIFIILDLFDILFSNEMVVIKLFCWIENRSSKGQPGRECGSLSNSERKFPNILRHGGNTGDFDRPFHGA